MLSRITIGIDAANIRHGGGRTHLMELLGAASPEAHGVEKLIVWGSKETLALIVDKPWLEKINPPALDAGFFQRTLWQRFKLSKAARDAGCDVLFVPGGSYAGNFHPVVTMSQNLLPFEMQELQRYGWTFVALKLLLLRLTQSCSFQKAKGVIFLTEYARKAVLKVTGKLKGETSIVPHGINRRFNSLPKMQRDIAEYNDAHPYRVLYVSIIDQYKHQWHVVEAIATIRKQGFPVVLDLVGSAYPPALRRLNTKINSVDVSRSWVHYHGPIAFDALHHLYAQVDLGLFASTCENMPNILLETMAAGLPVACSNRGPMPEVLGDCGIYFDPEDPKGIASAIQALVDSRDLRSRLANKSFERAQQYSWPRCADETFSFLAEIGRSA